MSSSVAAIIRTSQCAVQFATQRIDPEKTERERIYAQIAFFFNR
jgi:hypothetical protein